MFQMEIPAILLGCVRYRMATIIDDSKDFLGSHSHILKGANLTMESLSRIAFCSHLFIVLVIWPFSVPFVLGARPLQFFTQASLLLKPMMPRFGMDTIRTHRGYKFYTEKVMYHIHTTRYIAHVEVSVACASQVGTYSLPS